MTRGFTPSFFHQHQKASIMTKDAVIALLGRAISDGTPSVMKVPTQDQINNWLKIQAKNGLSNFDLSSGATFMCDNEQHFFWPGSVFNMNGGEFVYLRRGAYINRRGIIERRLAADATPGTPKEWTASMKEHVKCFFNKEKMVEAYSNPEVREAIAAAIAEGAFVKNAIVVPKSCKNCHSYPIGHPSLIFMVFEDEWVAIRPDGSKGTLLQKNDLEVATPEQVAWFFDHCPQY